MHSVNLTLHAVALSRLVAALHVREHEGAHHDVAQNDETDAEVGADGAPDALAAAGAAARSPNRPCRRLLKRRHLVTAAAVELSAGPATAL